LPTCSECVGLLHSLLDHRNRLREEKVERENDFAADILREEIDSGAFGGDFKDRQARALVILEEAKTKEKLKREEAKARREDCRLDSLEEIRISVELECEGARDSILSYNTDDFEFDNFTSTGAATEDEDEDEDEEDNDSTRRPDSPSFSLNAFLRELTEARNAEAGQRVEILECVNVFSSGSFLSEKED
jgi:hypothetical protein